MSADYRILDNEFVIYDALGDEKARVPFRTKEEVISLFNNDMLNPKEKGIYGMLFSEKSFLPSYLPSKQKWQIIEAKNSQAYQDAWVRNYDQPMSLKAAAMIVRVRNDPERWYTPKQCPECGSYFGQTVGEVEFFEFKGLTLPKKCYKCRGKENDPKRLRTLIKLNP